MFRLLHLPTMLLILVAGCSVQGELEYGQSQNDVSVEATKEDESHRQGQREQSSSGLHMKWASNAGSERAAPTPTKETPQSPAAIYVEPKPLTIRTGDINIHVGDVHYHEHKHVTVDQSITVTAEVADVMQVQTPSTSTKEEEQVTPLDPRCERIRLEHDERVAGWARLFRGD